MYATHKISYDINHKWLLKIYSHLENCTNKGFATVILRYEGKYKAIDYRK